MCVQPLNHWAQWDSLQWVVQARLTGWLGPANFIITYAGPVLIPLNFWVCKINKYPRVIELDSGHQIWEYHMTLLNRAVILYNTHVQKTSVEVYTFPETALHLRVFAIPCVILSRISCVLADPLVPQQRARSERNSSEWRHQHPKASAWNYVLLYSLANQNTWLNLLNLTHYQFMKMRNVDLLWQ